jgi:cardiolipin-specific phospholipase
MLRKLGPFTGRFVRGYLKKRWKTLSKEEMGYMEIYLQHVNLYPGSGEYALKELFVEGGFAIAPLCARIVNTPTVFIYGDKDWMDPEGATMNAEYNHQRVIRKIISNSGHHMYIDNPQELTEKIISALIELD